jgi:hypothetical protein
MKEPNFKIEYLSQLKCKLFFYLIILILGIPQLIFRFKHPEMNETQLFLNFFHAYKEFFYGMD